jgi:cytochrome c2
VSAVTTAAALCLALATVAAATPIAAQETGGDAARGGAVFEGKRCVRCHRPRGQTAAGPALDELRRPQGAFELAGRLWNHAPAMFTRLAGEGLEWPEINREEMGDLMAYLQAVPGRDPTPDPARGETILLRKGCLKCHSFRSEGGRVAPELTGGPSIHESAAAWASKMWKHTPRMAVMARERGVLYPRFSGSEMEDLLAFLRRATEPSR